MEYADDVGNIIDHIQSPRNRGGLEAPDAVGLAGSPGRGPFIVLYLRIQSDTVSEAKYQSEGCGPTIASGSILTELIIGRKLDECRALSPDDLHEELGDLPRNKQHCPVLAINALKSALADWDEKQSQQTPADQA